MCVCVCLSMYVSFTAYLLHTIAQCLCILLAMHIHCIIANNNDDDDNSLKHNMHIHDRDGNRLATTKSILARIVYDHGGRQNNRVNYITLYFITQYL